MSRLKLFKMLSNLQRRNLLLTSTLKVYFQNENKTETTLCYSLKIILLVLTHSTRIKKIYANQSIYWENIAWPSIGEDAALVMLTKLLL